MHLHGTIDMEKKVHYIDLSQLLIFPCAEMLFGQTHCRLKPIADSNPSSLEREGEGEIKPSFGLARRNAHWNSRQYDTILGQGQDC